jgi:hypothetical protein
MRSTMFAVPGTLSLAGLPVHEELEEGNVTKTAQERIC